MPVVRTLAPVSDGTNVVSISQIDVRGIGKVSIAGKNNNAGTKTLVVTVYLGV